MPFAVASAHPVRYWNGAVVLSEADITIPGGGFFGHQRSYNNQTSASYNGPNGWNWFVMQMPYIVASGSSVAVVFDPNNPYWFDQSGTTFTPRYGMVGVGLTEDLGAGTFTFTMTGNGQFTTVVFYNFSWGPSSGQLISYTDSRGVVTTVTSRSGNLINESQRSYTLGGTTIVDSLVYTYFTTGSAANKLQTATYRQQVGGGAWNYILQCLYGYYGASDPNGSVNDLQSAAQQIPDGMGGWNTVGVDYYRYWLAGASTGFAHGLKMHFGPEAYRLLFNAGIDPTTASDATMQPYADHYFEYDPYTWAVTEEIAAVCASCTGGGTTSDTFTYTPNPSSPSPGYNVWAVKTVQTLPDSSTITVYTNYIGLPMLYVQTDSTGANRWITFYRYDANAHLIWTALPSAVNGYDDSYNDLLNYDSISGLYQYLNNDSGQIRITDYYSTTGGGAAAGYVSDYQVQEGQSGTPVLLQSLTYSSNTDSSGNTIYPIATRVLYPNAGEPTITITTGFSYTYASGTNYLQQRTTTLPAISAAQNGDGTTPTKVAQYDSYGNLTQTTNELGIVNTYAYGGLGLVSQQVLNYQSGITAPGVNVTTDFAYDSQGRLIQTTGPQHTVDLSGTATSVQGVTWKVYVQSIQPGSGTWGVDQTWTGTGYAVSGPTYTLIDPVIINNTDKDGRSTDVITSHRTTGSGALSPTDTFVQTDWQSWSSTQYNEQHQTISDRVYFLIPSSGTGTVGTNYGETDYAYDALERRNRKVAPGGTITRMVWTAPQQIASIWVGTNDTGATDSDPTGGGASGNNMVLVTANVWDNGLSGGDRNLTQIIQDASVNSISTDQRITAMGYDFRNRQISITDAMVGFTAFTYDNLNRRTMTQGYSSPGGNLISQSGTNYDDRSRVYQQIVYAVNIATGVVGNSLVGNLWYDYSGNLLQQTNPGDGIVFTKSSYNGVNWVTGTYKGYNPSGTSFSQAGTVANDIIMEQAINSFDEVGNIIEVDSFQRLNDAPSSGSGSTGALSYASNPKARVSYAAMWFDGIDRVIANANYGALSSFTRPSTPPASSATVLVNLTNYNTAGLVGQAVDAKGVVNLSSYDDAARRTELIEDYGSGGGYLNRTTNWTYTLDNLIATLTAINAVTGNQTTAYTYGSNTNTSGVARKDLLVTVTYPDSITGSDEVDYTYNRQGQVVNIIDQNENVRTLLRDKLGRTTDDCVTTVSGGIDTSVLRISTTYEPRGMIATVSSWANPTPTAGFTASSPVNQCVRTYNDFAQLAVEQQSYAGVVKHSTPSVQYAYDSGASGSNEIRLNALTYPNLRVINLNFASGMDSYLNRVTSISDSSATLAAYTYLGLGMVVRITYPQPEVWLDLWGGTSGVFAGLDQFNRIIDQRWQNAITSTPADIDRYQYGYDQNSNRQYKANVVGTPIVTNGLDEYYTYDDINRLTDMQRGTLNGTNTGISGTPTIEQTWTLDPTGNWSGFVTAASGTTNLNQTRTNNTVNEITNITESTGPTWIVPAYDAAGNMITMPQVANPTQQFNAIYDAWNRLINVNLGTTSNTIASYTYDGFNRRNRQFYYASGGGIFPTSVRNFYFTANWQDIEERIGTSISPDTQYVWAPLSMVEAGNAYIDQLVCRDDATPQRLYACQDANFNVTSITNTSGAVQERYLYDPYGTFTFLNGSWSVISASAFAWVVGRQGLLYDAASGLVYNRSRILHPLLATLLQRDMAGYADGMNLYLASRSNPVRFLDPSGAVCLCSGAPAVPPTPCTIGAVFTATAWGISCNPPLGASWVVRCLCAAGGINPFVQLCRTKITWTCAAGMFSGTIRWIISAGPTYLGCP